MSISHQIILWFIKMFIWFNNNKIIINSCTKLWRIHLWHHQSGFHSSVPLDLFRCCLGMCFMACNWCSLKFSPFGFPSFLIEAYTCFWFTTKISMNWFRISFSFFFKLWLVLPITLELLFIESSNSISHSLVKIIASLKIVSSLDIVGASLVWSIAIIIYVIDPLLYQDKYIHSGGHLHITHKNIFVQTYKKILVILWICAKALTITLRDLPWSTWETSFVQA